MALPPDPGAFVTAAERGINERDLDATAGVYAPDARLLALTDGAREEYAGAEAIRRGWDGYLRAMARRGFTLRKRLLAADGDLVINDWTGSVAGRTDARGIEHWRFGTDGRVTEHVMYTFLNVKSSRSPLQRARLGLAYPVTSGAFLLGQRRAGARPS